MESAKIYLAHKSRTSPRGQPSFCRTIPQVQSPSPCHKGSGQEGRRSGKEWRREKHSQSPSQSSYEHLMDHSQKRSTGEAIRHRAERHLDEYDRKLHEINLQLANLQGESHVLAGFSTRPPLSCHIMEEPIPSWFKMPRLKPYDSTTDLLDHLESYKTFMRIQGTSNALLCMAFSATLWKVA